MSSYPALPDLTGCDIVGMQEGFLDGTISTPFENGMQQTRQRYSRIRRSWTVPYRYVPLPQKVAFELWLRTVVQGSSGIFVWVEPNTGEVINVRFAANKTPQITEAGYVGSQITYSFNLEIEEV